LTRRHRGGIPPDTATNRDAHHTVQQRSCCIRSRASPAPAIPGMTRFCPPGTPGFDVWGQDAGRRGVSGTLSSAISFSGPELQRLLDPRRGARRLRHFAHQQDVRGRNGVESRWWTAVGNTLTLTPDLIGNMTYRLVQYPSGGAASVALRDLSCSRRLTAHATLKRPKRPMSASVFSGRDRQTLTGRRQGFVIRTASPNERQSRSDA
jgi:hypothetical protein